ncbi:TPA: type II toxin-antitoxin system RelB/DinJ family antitoxin [Escherichia coli]
MMATINARIDDDIKAQADDVLKRLYISHTQAISALYQYIASNGCLPFTVTMLVEDLDDKILKQFWDSSVILNSLRKSIEDTGELDGKVALKKLRRLEDNRVIVWNEILQVQSKNRFIRIDEALKKTMSVLEDFKKFGYGYQMITVSAEERNNFSSAVEFFDEQLRTFWAEGDDDIAAKDILRLDQEVEMLKRLHEESQKDPSLTMAERKAISNEYIAKYNRLNYSGKK